MHSVQKEYFSFKNHTIERVWVEVNTRINYPIKEALIAMCDDGEISTDDELSKACISWFSMQVATRGTAIFVDAWNSHAIPGIVISAYISYE